MIDLIGGADGTRTRDPRRDRPLSGMALSAPKSVTYMRAVAPFNRKKRRHKPLNIHETDPSNGATSCGDATIWIRLLRHIFANDLRRLMLRYSSAGTALISP